MQLKRAFGLVLRSERVLRELSQEQLAFKSGLSPKFISLLERGQRQPTLETLVKLSIPLHIPPDKLVKKTFKLFRNNL